MGMFALGLDDLLFDLMWIVNKVRGRLNTPTLTQSQLQPTMRFAVFVPLWREAGVIRPMVEHMVQSWPEAHFDLYLACYPNDYDTVRMAKVLAGVHPNVHCVVGPRDGPTTKADNLNMLWNNLQCGNAAQKYYDAVLLHDAEDQVHPDELALYSVTLMNSEMVQTPVVPLPDTNSKWVAGHYLDEFAEAHGKEMPLRNLLGAPIPSAGVGTALSVQLLKRTARERGNPFDSDSVTEDYELGWRLGLQGNETTFARAIGSDGRLIATRAYFPDRMHTSIRQKTRWVLGIALQGWDRLAAERIGSDLHRASWSKKFIARWMLWRDRRSVLSAILLLAGYWAAILYACIWLIKEAFPQSGAALSFFPQNWLWLLTATTILVIWRLLMRAYFTWATYGAAEALLSIPRVIVSNAVAIVASHRALFQYLKWTRGAPQQWDKTDHRFPDAVPDALPDSVPHDGPNVLMEN